MPEFRLYLLRECLINPPPPPPEIKAAGVGAALLAIFVPKLIETAISGLASVLKKAGDEETEQLAAAEFRDLYVADAKQALSVNKELGCLLGVWFENVDKKPPSDNNVTKKLKTAGLVPAAAEVGGVFEAAIRPAADGTAFFLDTRYFCAWEFVGSRRRDERAYVATLSLATPSASDQGSVFAVGTIDLGKRTRGEEVVKLGHPLDAFPRVRSNLMPWSKISEASKAAYDRDVAAGQAAGRRYMPVAFSLTLTETADGSKFLLKLGEFLEGTAKDAGAAISKKILPAEIEKTEAEQAANAEKFYEEELKAELEVRKAQAVYDKGKEEEKPALRVVLEIAKRKLAWQTSLREAAGLPARLMVEPK